MVLSNMPMCVGDSRDSVQSLHSNIGHEGVKSKCCLSQVGYCLCERYHLGKYFGEILIIFPLHHIGKLLCCITACAVVTTREWILQWHTNSVGGMGYYMIWMGPDVAFFWIFTNNEPVLGTHVSMNIQKNLFRVHLGRP